MSDRDSKLNTYALEDVVTLTALNLDTDVRSGEGIEATPSTN
tara:strand:+ start:7150 stop:7275 length:126 start_codon:yes stop_codon:yes gene_type:complete